MKHWWSERDPKRRAQLRESSSPDDDEDARRRLIGAPINSRRRTLRRDTNAVIRNRCLALCEQIEKQLAEARLRREKQCQQSTSNVQAS